MASKLNIDVNLRNGDRLRKLGDDATTTGDKIKKALAPYPGAAQAWNPYISALQKIKAAQKEAADAAKKLADENKNAVASGAASKWSPQISAVKQYEAAVKKAAQAEKAAARDAVTAQKAAAADVKAARKAASAAAKADARDVAAAEKAAARDAAAAQRAAINDVRNARRAAARDAKLQAQSQALGPVNALVPAGGKINTFSNRYQAGKDAAQERYGAAADFAKGAGLGALAIGGGGAMALGASAQAAGQWQQWEVAFTKMEGSAQAGQKRLEELNQFAMSTPFSMPGIVKNAQMLRAMNFEGNELVPTMKALGNAMAASGQGEDVLNRVALNLGQIRSMEHPKQVDLNQFAYAGLNVKKIMSVQMGKEMSMDDIKDMGGKEFVDNFLKGLEKEFGGTLEKQLDTLPGALNNLSDSFFRLKVAIGGPLTPAITLVAKATSAAVGWFVKLPGPIKTTVSILAALGTGIVILTGVLLTAAGPILNAIIAHAALTGAIAAEGTAAGTASVATGGLAASMGTFALSVGILMGAIALATVAIAIAIDQWNKNKDKITNPTATNYDARTGQEKYSDSVSKGNVDQLLGDSKDMSAADRYAILEAGISKYGELNEADVANAAWEEKKALQKKYGSLHKRSTSAEAKEIIAKIKGQAATDKAKQMADNGSDGFKVSESTSETDDLKKQAEEIKQQANEFKATLGGGAPAALATAMNIGGDSDGSGAIEDTEALQGDIDSLQDQIRHAKKEEKPALRDRLVAAQRALRDTKRLTAAQKRDAKAKERAAKKANKIAVDNAQLEFDVREAEADEKFQTQIATLEAQRDEAKDAKNKAREKQLQFEIDSLKARRDYAVAMLQADEVALENEKKGDAQRRIAKTKLDGASKRAQIERDKKSGKELLLSKLKRGASLFGAGGLSKRVLSSAGAALSSLENGSMFNPYQNAAYAGTSGAFTRVVGEARADNEAYAAGSGSNKRVLEFDAPKRRQAANGDWVFKIPELRVPNPLDDF